MATQDMYEKSVDHLNYLLNFFARFNGGGVSYTLMVAPTAV